MTTNNDTITQLLNGLANGSHRTRPAIIIQQPNTTRTRPKRNKKTTVGVSKRKPGVRTTKRLTKVN